MDHVEQTFDDALAKFRTGDLAGAEPPLRRNLAQAPNHVPSLSLLAQIAGRTGRDTECVALLERAMDVGTAEQAAAAGAWLGAAHRRAARLDAAAAAFRRSADLNPDPATLNALGAVLAAAGDLAGAGAAFGQVLALRPGAAEPLYNLATIRKGEGRTDEAVELFRQVVAGDPDLGAARFALVMAHLSPLYADEPEIGRRRQDYAAGLDDLIAHADLAGVGMLAAGVGAAQPFQLAYQGRNDLELQQRYGDLVCRAMAAAYPPAQLADPPEAGERLRVGVVCGYLRDHSVWRLPTRGWVEGLNRDRFELIGFHTGALCDDETERARGRFDRFVQGPLPFPAWREQIIAARPHVLIHPEIGMDPMAARLAALRLAPAQYASWGHPSTSGYPTIDYFLSSDAMEPPDAQGHYSETLVRLPGLSTAFTLPQAPPPTPRAELGLPDEAVIYWCGQSLFKYLPQHDKVFAKIAARVPRSRFVFVEFPGSPPLTQRFRDRLSRAFAARGLKSDEHCLVLPRLDALSYRAATGCADLMLDSVGWSGCNSVLDAFAFALPVVTWPDETMRSRHAAALLTEIGLDDQVCRTLDDYIELAVQWGSDPQARQAARDRLRAALPGLNRTSAIPALEAHLRMACG